jgi:hypothetical protein
MRDNMGNKKKIFTDERIVLIIRWWVAGAIYFFIGWGTSLGYNGNIIDLVFFLGLTIGVVNSFVLNPILNKMFNLKTSKKYMEISVISKVKSRLAEIFKGMLIVLMMVYCYAFINTLLINLFNLPANSIPLPGEPITFGILYTLLFVLLEKIKGLFIRARKE